MKAISKSISGISSVSASVKIDKLTPTGNLQLGLYILISLINCNQYNKYISIMFIVPENDAEIYIRSIKYDILSEPEFDSCWKLCTQYRLNQIKNSNSIDEIFKKWPQYQSPNGHRLVIN